MSFLEKLKHYESEVVEFNALAGNLTEVTPEILKSQFNVVREELHELIEKGIEVDNQLEIIDGAIDLYVTAAGLMIQSVQYMIQLEQQGYSVNRALAKVCYNNLLKFPKKEDVAKYQWDEGIVVQDCEADSSRVVGKDINGKVRKYKNFPKVDLTDCLPKE